MVRSETVSLLGGVGRRQQQLLDAQGMHAKLDADMNALNSIIGKGSSTRTSSLLKTSLSARIIAQADEVKQQAAHLATTQTVAQKEDKTLAMTPSQDSAALTTAQAKPRPGAAAREPSQAQEEKQLEATTSTPFAKDKKWSVAEEGKDMDSFFDSLDGGAAAKEASVREKHSRKAAEHVAEEAKHEDMAFRREEHKPPKVALPKRLREREAADRKADEVKGAEGTKGGQAKGGKGAAPAKPMEERSAFAGDRLLERHGGGAGSVGGGAVLAEKRQASAPPPEAPKTATPRAGAAAGAKGGADANPKMSAGKLRSSESSFFQHLSGGSADGKGGQAGKGARGDTVNRKISDAQERASVESFFDGEISAAKKRDALHGKGAKGAAQPKMSASAATKDLAAYWKGQQAAASRQDTAHAPNPKMSAAQARSDFNSYFAEQEKRLRSESRREQRLLAREEGVGKGKAAPAPAAKEATPAAEAAAPAAKASPSAHGAGAAGAAEAVGEGLPHVTKGALQAAARGKAREERADMRQALGARASMPGAKAGADMDRYYDGLQSKARRKEEEDARSASAAGVAGGRAPHQGVSGGA